jgi:hypothetical protein
MAVPLQVFSNRRPDLMALFTRKFVIENKKNDLGFQPAYATINVKLTKNIRSDLSRGHCEVVDHASYFFMHGYVPFTRERVIRAQKTRAIQKKKKKKSVVPLVRAEDWFELDQFGPFERRVVCDELVDELSATRRKKLRDRIHAIFNLHHNGGHTSVLALQDVSECDEAYASECDEVVSDYDFDHSSELLRAGIEPNPGPTDPIDIPRSRKVEAAKNAGLFHQQNFMCALNELVQKNNATLSISTTRLDGTPDHDPKFSATVVVTFPRCTLSVSFSASAVEGKQVLAREVAARRCLEFVCCDDDLYLRVLPSSHWIRDLLRENVESNPGPTVHSTLRMRINDPSMRNFERAFAEMKMLDNFGKSIDEIKNLNGTLNQLSRTVDGLLPLLSSTVTNTTCALLEIKDDIIKFGLIFILLQGLFLIGAKRVAICGCLIVLGRILKFDEYLMSLFDKLCDQFKNPVVQMELEDALYSDHFSIIGKIIFGCMAFLCIKQIPGKQDWDNYIVRLAKIPQAAAGGKKIWETCSEYFTIALDNVKMMCLGKNSKNFSVTTAYVQEIKDWMQEVSDCTQLDERKKVNHDEAFAKRVSDLYVKGQIFSHDTTLPPRLSRAVQNTLMPAYRLYQYVETAPSCGAGPKMRPVSLWLHGDSQIGKSTVVWAVCADLLVKMGHSDFKHRIYARQPETEYWDGYVEQPIIVYDDAFALRDDKLKPNPEVHEVIRAQNNFPQHVHMAALQDKNTYNKAQVLIYTSNEPNVTLESITFKDAFHNRMNDNCYRVTLKDEFAKVIQQPDGGKKIQILDQSKIISGISTDIYIFQKQINDKGVFIDVGDPISYNVLRTRLVKEWRVKKNSFANHMDFLNNRMATDWEEVNHEEVADVQMRWSDLLSPKTESEPEEFVDCIDSVDFVKTKIAELRNAGKDPMEVREWFAQSDEMWNMWQNYIKANQPPNKYKKMFEESISVCSDYLNRFGEACKKLIIDNPIISLLTLFGSAVAVGAIAYSFLKSDDDDEVELAHSGNTVVPRVKGNNVELAHSGSSQISVLPRANVQFSRQKLVNSAMELITRAEVEGCSDPNAHEIVSGKVRKNSFRLTVSNMSGNVTFVKGKIFVMPYHFLVMMFAAGVAADEVIYLSQDENSRIISFPFKHLVDFHGTSFKLTENVVQYNRHGNESDLVFVNLHKMQSYPMCDISQLFITRNQQSLLSKGSYSGAFLTYDHDRKGNEERLWRCYKWFGNINSHDSALELDYPKSLSLSPLKIRNFYKYEGVSVPGDCGSVLAVYNNQIDRKLIGMHNAGRGGVGYAVPLTCEGIEEHCAKFRVEAQFCLELPDDVNPNESVVLPAGNFVAMGKSSIKVGQATKTVLRESRLHGHLLPVVKKPAKLIPFMNEGELYDPLMEGLKKCGQNCPILDNDVLDEITSVLSPLINCENVNFAERHKYERFLSYTEAVIGAEDEFMHAINRTTSAGFPWCNDVGKKPGKQSYLGSDDNYDAFPPNFKTLDGKRVYDAVMNLIEDCSNKVLRNVVSVDTKKDELRPIHKISTRIFSACPQHFVIAFRMYYLPFCSWIMHNRHYNGIAVGVNPFAPEWDFLTTKLKEMGPKVIAGDFTNYDGSLNSQVLWAIFHNIFIPWVKYMHGSISDEDYNICFGLWSHLTHSVHIFDSNVYMWTHSQPSGNPMTAILNSLYNIIIMRYSWHIIFKNTKLVGQQNFSKFVYMIAYGDDNVLNISDIVANEFNQQTISSALATIGHTYTDEAKTGEIVKYRTLSEVQFLKRGFVFDTKLKRYVAPLDQSVIYEMLNWVRKSKSTLNVDDVLLTNVQVAFREIVYHGEGAYNELKQKITSNLHLFPKNNLPIIRPYLNLLLDVSMGFDVDDYSFF